VWAALGAVYLIWGSTYLAIRVMVETVPVLLGAGLRFVVAGAALLLVMAARRPELRTLPARRDLARLAAIGTLLAAGGNGLVTVAEKHVPSALSALVIASVPLWIVVFRSLTGDRPRAATVAGVALGFAGVALLLLPANRPAGVHVGGLLILVAAAMSWAWGSLLAQRWRVPAHPLMATGWQMLAGGTVMMVSALAAGELGDIHWSAFSAKSVWSLAYLILIGSLVGYSAYTWLLENVPISKVSTYAYVNPVVAVILGWAILGEHISLTILAASLLIVTAVAAIVRSSAAPASAPPARPARPWRRRAPGTRSA
jgi:drug/metabolite transporter (DMT)-like permease